MRAQLTFVACVGLCGLIAACSGTGITAAGGAPATMSFAQPGSGNVVSLPSLRYEILRSGPPTGRRPLRSDDVMIRYVGRLEDGSIFSTSAADGTEPSSFSVRTVIPGFSALIQLMRPGDRWRFIIPGYLGYGHEGRRFNPPEATLRRDIPPGSTLVFDVELVSIKPTEPPPTAGS